MKAIATVNRTELRTITMGPLVVRGHVKIVLPNGVIEIKERCYICRCGRTAREPYCDGSHVPQ